MGQPKRKQSKQRSRKRRGAVTYQLPQLAKDPRTALSSALTASIRPTDFIVVAKF